MPLYVLENHKGNRFIIEANSLEDAYSLQHQYEPNRDIDRAWVCQEVVPDEPTYTVTIDDGFSNEKITGPRAEVMAQIKFHLEG